MAATNYTPIQLYYSTTASAAPTAGNLMNGELAINITDGKLYYKDNGGVVQVIATKGAGTIGGSNTQIQFNDGGALAGNAAMVFNKATNVTTLTTLNLTNALGATYGGTAQSAYTQGDILYASATNTLSKLGIGTVNYILTSTGSVPQWVAPTSVTVQTANNLAGGVAGSVPYQSAADTTTFLAIGAANRVMTSTGSAPQWVTSLTGLTGVSSSAITNTALTSGRLVYSTTGGAQTDSANLTFDGTTLSATGLSTTGASTLVKLVKVGDSSFTLPAVLSATAPAKLYVSTATVTDGSSANGATNALGTITSFGSTTVAASNTGVTYTNLATLYIAGAPAAGTNVTITNPYAFYVAGGASYFGGAVDFAVTPSYSGGTANGVMYLNGSKQITTGSALTFDGAANLSFTGTGLYPVVAVYPTGNNAIFGFRMDASAGNGVDWRVEQGRSAVGDFNITAPALISSPQYVILKNLSAQYWSLGAAGEKMRLNSTGLGIGTSDPVALLDVVSGTNTTLSVPSGVVAKFKGGITLNSLSTASSGNIESLYFQKSHTTGVNISNYDLGIITAYTGNGYTGGLDFYTGKNTGGGSYAATFAMRIDEAQQVGIGTNNPNAKLAVRSDATGGDATVRFRGTDTTARLTRIQLEDYSGTLSDGLIDFVVPTAGTASSSLLKIGVNSPMLTMNYNGAVSLMGAVTNASGVGITFPATQVASSNANTLDDYEEGTFTPTLAGGFSSGPTSYTQNGGSYTKIGRYVFFQLDLDANGATADGSFVKIGGLPFTSAYAGGFAGASISYQVNFNTNGTDTYHITGASNAIDVYDVSGNGRAGNAAGVNINNRIILFGSYQTST